MIGTLLHKRYRLDAELGRGAMAVVYRAHDTVLKRDVAVKVMSEAIALGTEGRARLLHEAQATAGLNHPTSSQCMTREKWMVPPSSSWNWWRANRSTSSAQSP